MNYLADVTARTMTIKNFITVAVVGLYLYGLVTSAELLVDALAVPAGMAIAWAVERKPAA